MTTALEEVEGFSRIELAEKPPWEIILASLPRSERALARVDDAAAARVLDAYNVARQRLADDITRLWNRTFGAGVMPTIGQMTAMVRNQDVLRALDARQTELDAASVEAVTKGYNEAAILAVGQSTIERQAMARAFPVLAHGQPFVHPGPGLVEEVGINKAVQDAKHIAKLTRDAASASLVASALAGEGIVQMKRRLAAPDGPFAGNARRAELTSRYATIKAYNEVRQGHYAQTKTTLAQFGRVVYKIWIVARDDRTCPICLALAGTVVDVEGDFDLTATFDKRKPPKGWPIADQLRTPPRHARCRCSIAPWVDGWQHGTSLTPNALREQARELAKKAGYLTDVTPKGAGVPRPGPPRLHAAQVRALPKDRYDAAVSGYLACATGSPVLPARFVPGGA